MLTTLFATALLGSISMDNQCNVEVEGQLKLQHKQLEVMTQDGELVRIGPDYSLSVDGVPISLNAQQQQQVQHYYDGVYDTVPMVYDIASEAVGLAGQGVSQAFGELLGHNDGLVEDIQDLFDGISSDIQQRFYDSGGNIHFHTDGFKDGDFLGRDFENRVEEEMEALMQRSIGKFMIMLGKEMLLSGGDMDGFEQRMERFGEDLEQRMEIETAEIELKGEQLCSHLLALDDTETRLQQDIPALQRLDALQSWPRKK